MFVVGSLVGLGGYLLGWYAFCLLRGPAGLGIVDLILPSRVGKVDAWLAGGSKGAASSAAAGAAIGGAIGGGTVPPIPIGQPGAAPPSRTPGGGLPPPGSVAGQP